MDSLDEIRKKRFKLLHQIYETSGGHQDKLIMMWEIGRVIGFEKDEVDRFISYLVGEGLVEHVAMGGWIRITHYGIKQVEAALSAPNEPTKFFPPVMNVINIQSMVGSQIQQGTKDSSQAGRFQNSGDLQPLRDFLELFKRDLQNLNLPSSQTHEVTCDVETIEAQLKSSKPKPGILKEALTSLRTVLEGAAGNILASDFLLKLNDVARALGF